MSHRTNHFGVDVNVNRRGQIGNQLRRLQCLLLFLLAHLLPNECLYIRSELLDQLAKWHKLSEAGVVSDMEYEGLKKKNFLSDIIQKLCLYYTYILSIDNCSIHYDESFQGNPDWSHY